MANVSSPNELVTGTPGLTDTGLYACWRLVRTLISAGWTVAQSSNGTSYGAADYWTTASGLGAGAWIVLTGPGGRQFCFWRDTAGSLWTGKVIYSKSGGHTFSGALATNPGTLPATAQYMRGSAGAFISWFGGGTKAIKFLHVFAKDVADGSFWLIGTTPSTASGSFHHTFGFFSLVTYDAADTDPYILYCSANGPTVDTTSTNAAQYGGAMARGYEDTTGTAGYWWGWARNAAWKPFSISYEPVQTSAGVYNADVTPYTAGTPFLLLPAGVGKTEAAFRERKGWLRYGRISGDVTSSIFEVRSNENDAFAWIAVGFNNGSVGPQIVWWWDGVSPVAAYDY